MANLVSAQREAGWNSEVITATVGEALHGVTRITAPIPFDIPIHPRTRHRLMEHFVSLQPSVVHVHLGAASPFAWGALRATRDMGLPTVITVHSMWGGISRAGYHLFTRQLTGSSFVWSAVSTEAGQSVQEALRLPVHVMPNGINVEQWTSHAIPSDHLRVIGVLRMAPRKRVVPWLSIIREVQGIHPEVSAVLVGDGPLLAYAKRYVKKHQMNVSLPGRLNHSQLRELYSRSDVFLQSSTRESFGIAALEARAAGLVVVAREGTGTGSFIADGINGFLEEDDQLMARRLLWLADDSYEVASIKENNQAAPIYDLRKMLTVSGQLYEMAQRQ